MSLISVQQIRTRIEDLEVRLERLQPEIPGIPRPAITAGQPNFALPKIRVAGHNFAPGSGIIVRIMGRQTFIRDFAVSSNPAGQFDEQLDFTPFSAFIPPEIFLAARDDRRTEFDLTGFFWSNTVSIIQGLSSAPITGIP